MNMQIINSFLSTIGSGEVTTPIDNNFDLFIVAGQSNTDGRVLFADAPSWLDQSNPINPNVKVWNSIDNQFNQFELGVDTGSNLPNTTNWAYDLIFTHQYVEHYNRPLYLVKRTKGGTPIYIDLDNIKGSWNIDFANIPDGFAKLLLELHERYDAAKAFANSVGKSFNLKGILWHQGEGDYGIVDAYNNYETNFSNVISYIRNVITDDPTLPIIFGSISHVSAQYNAIVETAQFNVAANDDNAYIVDMSSGTLLDAYHFDATSTTYLGTEMFNIFKTI